MDISKRAFLFRVYTAGVFMEQPVFVCLPGAKSKRSAKERVTNEVTARCAEKGLEVVSVEDYGEVILLKQDSRKVKKG